jgi:hypothetical protein
MRRATRSVSNVARRRMFGRETGVEEDDDEDLTSMSVLSLDDGSRRSSISSERTIGRETTL